ncbi:MAG: Re/Si-specific NAD(P)(+) transhydrogenase subunit alpha [Thermoanaerobaculia bacterium]|nr:Re/Si-specific NAD(P)(+) transhydrogenase subunit alpha [Thermoanaerobaculia bacterium]
MQRIFIPRETAEGENRVAATPETVRRLTKAGFELAIETGAGARSFFSDEAYREAGAETASAADWTADVVLKVAPPTPQEAHALGPETLLVGFVSPHQNLEAVRALRDGKVSTLAMELIPRITRAQSMDALSSQASIAGYKAVLLAAARLPKYFPLLMTAAGTIKPARVVVMGAGVAGLQAVATAKRLGAVVEVSDIRPEVEEQVESLGGRFIELPMEETGEGEGGYAKEMGEDFLRRQREIVSEHVAAADVVITTAQIPGKPAPMLVPREMVERMAPGSVIVDLAVSTGGNCELARPDEEVDHEGVKILGIANLPATMPRDASALYARNVQNLILELTDEEEGAISLDLDDEIVDGALLTHEGSVRHDPTREALGDEAESPRESTTAGTETGEGA